MGPHPRLRQISSRNVVLPDADTPQAAVITVDIDSGKIVNIKKGTDGHTIEGDVQVIDVGDKFVLPGAVE